MAASEAVATLAGGCFWCLEAVYKELRGVTRVKSGYAGGHLANPDYRSVCTGTTGHAEVVQVAYDPDIISYADLLRVFYTIHDPTTANRQGNDVGTQYRSAIYTGSDDEDRVAREVTDEIAAAGLWDGEITTEITRLPVFYPAEAEHDDYFTRNPGAGYCRVVVAPKVVKFRKQFSDRLKARAA